MGEARRFWLPKHFKLSSEKINSMLNHSRMQVVTKEELMGELMSEHFIQEHYYEVARTESNKLAEKMEEEEKEKT